MSLDAFLESLFEHGRVRVPAPGSVAEADRQPALQRLMAIEPHVRADFPGTAPKLDAPAALWGAEMLYQACQFAVYRDAGAEQMNAALGVACPTALSPAAIYSVDLALQYLPDLHRLTRQAAPADPLVTQIGRWAREWPLSSIGIPDVTSAGLALDIIIEHRGLRQRYVDRILQRGDPSRCTDPRVRDAVLASIGIHPTLAGELAKLFAAGQSTGAAE